jgi:hypothetical protein
MVLSANTAVHQAMATEARYGQALRHSAGLTGAAANDSTPQVRWWACRLQLALGIMTPSSFTQHLRNQSGR